VSGHSRLLAIIAGLAATAIPALAAPVDDPVSVPRLAPADRPQYVRFLDAPPHRAFAIGPSGQYGWSSGRDDQFSALLGAVYNCNTAGKVLCAGYAVDSGVVIDSYTVNAAQSRAALRQLRGIAPASTYASETADYGVSPRGTIHPLNTSGGTPVTVPGARTILTKYLVTELNGRHPPILIDVANSWGGHATLPGAIWMRGAGDDAGDKNGPLVTLFAELLSSMAPDRNMPLVIFCDSTVCWQSYNAALRAASAGYVNVYWYRGGVEAWRAAGLPTVTSVISAQLW
jgi:PQQ-dependent catabolism-associated CXXCW motif protein